MAATAAQFADFLEPKLSNIWHDAFPAFESRIARVYNTRDMNKNTITDAKLAGFGSLQSQNDGAEVQFDDPIADVTKAYTYAVKALAYRVHERLWRYDLYGEVERFERDLRDSAQDDVESAAASVLNNGFGTTNTGFDGLALFSTAHTRLDGGTNQANNPSTDEALSVSGLHNALITIRKWKNDRGRPRSHNARRLIVPPDLMITAMEILGSDKMPYTANNEPNVVATRFGLEDPVIWEYLTSTTAWFVQCDNHDLNWFWAFKPESGMRTDWKTESIERKIRQGYAYGFGEWRGIYGTDGVA
jgi:hypothetical protein